MVGRKIAIEDMKPENLVEPKGEKLKTLSSSPSLVIPHVETKTLSLLPTLKPAISVQDCQTLTDNTNNTDIKKTSNNDSKISNNEELKQNLSKEIETVSNSNIIQINNKSVVKLENPVSDSDITDDMLNIDETDVINNTFIEEIIVYNNNGEEILPDVQTMSGY
jgi:hypothetical protein